MIQDLTIENLLKSGCNTDEANRLYNTSETDVFQTNNVNFYVSKPDNKFYTGVDFYRITHLQKENLRFPYSCPDLVNEYFDLALTEFLEKQRTILGMLFNITDQTKIFISNEINITQQRIDSQKEYLLKMKLHKNESKKNDIQICEGYIKYLNNKTIEPQQPKAIIPDTILLENYHLVKNIFDDVKPEIVIKHFKKLVDNNYITQETFNDFLCTVFEKNKTLPIPIEILKPNSKTRVKKIFYEYYDKCTNKYGDQKKYINLLCDNFIGFNSKTLSTNFSK